MAAKNVYVCSNCGKQATSPLAMCFSCHAEDAYTLLSSASNPQKKTANITTAKPLGIARSVVRHISQIESTATTRISTGISEFDRVLGGGVVAGSVILLGGEPGMGKSTLCLQSAGNLSLGRTILYVSAEESAEQIKMRADRINLQAGDLQVVLESDLEVIMEEHIPNIKPDMLIIDSIHTIASSRIDGTPGSQRQLKHCEIYLRQLAKSTGMPILMIGQVTKGGDVAGSNSLQHDVDAVLYLEGDQNYLYRLLRGQKNRFGNVGEIGVFEMLGSGLIEVKNPSAAFLAERAVDKAGSAVVVTMEGDRPILAELQALTIHGTGGTPARRSNGVHKDRLHLLAAILEKHISYISLWDEDIYMSAAGGMKIVEPAADLPIAIAITSSWHEVATPSDMVAIGEIGLTGEIRNIPHAEMRLREAKKLGFRRVIMPPQGKSISKPSGLEIIEVRTLDEALHVAFEGLIDFEAVERVSQKVDEGEDDE